MIFNIIGLIVGVMILGVGIYYLIKERNDKEARNIYKITTIIGAVITAAIIIKMFV